jgi:thiol reductant ABC exporter CydD subunit
MRPLDPRLLQYAGATRPFVVATAAIGTATAGLVVAQAALLAEAIATTFLNGADLHRLTGTLLWLAGVVLSRSALSGLQEWVARRTSLRVQAELRNRLVAKVFELGPSWLSTKRSADIVLLSTRGITALDGYFARYLPQLVLAGLVPIVILGVLLPADLTAFVIVLCTIPLIPLFMALVGMTTEARTRRQWRTLELLGHHFLDVVSGLTTLKAYGRSRRQAKVIGRVSGDYRRATMATLRLAFLSSLVLELLATLSMALVAVAVGLRLVVGDLDLRTALMVLILAPEAYLPLRALGASYHASAEGLAAAEAVFAVLDEPSPDVSRVADSVAAESHSWPTPTLAPDAVIRLEGVSVSRPGRPGALLDSLDLVVRGGELLVLTGPSGAGKSTLVDVLLGFLPVDCGRIVVRLPGGTPSDLADVSSDRWRSLLAWVPQQPYVVCGTVAENVRLGAPDLSDDDLRRSLEAAGGLWSELPDGLATQVGERGAGLSIGQIRRLALARALVRSRPLLLLDEPTAGLDVESEQLVISALKGRPAGQTVIVVTHRPAMIAAADRVLALSANASAPARVVAA